MASLSNEESANSESSPLLTHNTKSHTKTIFKPLLLVLLFLLFPIIFYLYKHGYHPWYVAPLPPDWNDGSQWPDPLPVPSFEPLKRYSLNYRKVAYWQNDGVWIKSLTSVEMAYLGVDRFQDAERSLNRTDEDAICGDLRKLGASFWELPPRWSEQADGSCYVSWCQSIDCVKPTREVNLEVGFPTNGGVWILNMTAGWDALYPKRTGLFNTLTMDERCDVIKDLGGFFCENTQACPEWTALLKGAEHVPFERDRCMYSGVTF